MVFLGGHSVKYWQPSVVCVQVETCACVYCFSGIYCSGNSSPVITADITDMAQTIIGPSVPETVSIREINL